MICHQNKNKHKEIIVFIFCCDDISYTAPLPKLITAPVWLRMLGCTPNDASELRKNY
jgi:hypothetical protein